MEDEMENKFSRFNELRENFEQEKQRIVVIRALVAKYKT